MCKAVKLCTSTSTSNLLAPTMWPGRLQKQKESCKVLTMMVREKDGIGTSMLHSTRTHYAINENLTDYGYSGMVNGMKVPYFSKKSRALSWRQWSMLHGPNQKNMVHILMQLCLSGPNGHKERLYNSMCL